MTDVVLLSNRRGRYLPEALASVRHLGGVGGVTVIDDSGDPEWRRFIARDVPLIEVADQPAGYGAAMAAVWAYGRAKGEPVFLLEEDFTIERALNLADLHAVLEADPTLTQVALQRQPWYQNEVEAGGMIAAMRSGRRFEKRDGWLRHDAGFTGNPSLIATQSFHFDWPQVAWSEMAMSNRLRAAGLAFAYFGEEGEEYVTHHGSERAETSHGY